MGDVSDTPPWFQNFEYKLSLRDSRSRAEFPAIFQQIVLNLPRDRAGFRTIYRLVCVPWHREMWYFTRRKPWNDWDCLVEDDQDQRPSCAERKAKDALVR